MSLLEFVNLTYTYDGQQPLLRGASGQLEQGRLYAILGPSGCGKTTLLSLLGGLDSPQGGHILFQGKDIAETGLGQHRRRHVAFIFQSYNLIDYLTPAENVALASKLPPLPLLERLGLTKEEARRSVLQLSGGQQQRVAIARALASEAPGHLGRRAHRQPGRGHRPGHRLPSAGKRPPDGQVRGGGHPLPGACPGGRRSVPPEAGDAGDSVRKNLQKSP